MDCDVMIKHLKKSCWGESAHLVDKERLKAAETISTLQAENAKLLAEVDNWKKRFVEANGKWIAAENKWNGLDKAVKNGSVYAAIQEELKITQ